MKNSIFFVIIFIALSVFSCKDDNPTPPTPPPPTPSTYRVTSAEFQDNLLFVNRNDFQILTNKPATFISADPIIQISASGLIKRLTAGEVAAIEITWTDDPSKKTTIYALGATDDKANFDLPYRSFHGVPATDPYNSYISGWKTLQKLPVSNETYAIILRHGDANDGVDFSVSTGPANWWKSCENTSARQLNALGRTRSTELGKVLKDLKYPISRVISSEFCRSVETAKLMNIGPAIGEDARINHSQHNTTGKGLFRGMLDVMNEQPVDNKMTLVVMHHPVNETGSQGYPSFPLVSPFTWTGSYLISIAANKTITYQGAVSYAMFKHWRDNKPK